MGKSGEALRIPRKSIARNTGNSGRVNISGAELKKLRMEIGDEVDVDVADTKDVAHAIIDSKDTDRFLIVTPR
jgi:antitoxin component of MazEF toxin-antitoxin module